MKFIEKFRNQEGRDRKYMYNLTLCLVRVITIGVGQKSCIFSAPHYTVCGLSGWTVLLYFIS
jgi:hypothetical protein